MRSEFKVGAAVGSGVVARAAEDGGADFLLATSAGRLRNMGLPSIACMLPIRDTTEATLSFAVREVLPQAKVPVYVGLSGWSDPGNQERLICSVLEAGFAGVANFPTSMHYSGGMRALLENAGLGTRAEIALLRRVREAGGQVLFYCGTRDDARAAVEEGLDALVYNFGWNIGGADSHTAEISLEEAAQRARDVASLVRGARTGMRVFLEGGPILTADDLNFVIRHADIDGYVGGSTIDRFPVQHSVANQIAEYKSAARAMSAKTLELREALKEAARHGLLGESEAFVRFAMALMRAREGNAHMYLTAPPGVNVPGAVEFLSAGAGSSRSARSYDFERSASAHRINDLLFGREGTAREKTGLLLEGGDFVVLRNCGEMPKMIRDKLRTTMQTGRVQRAGGRETRPLASRIIFVSEDDAPPDWSDTPLVRVRYPKLNERHADVRAILDHMLGGYASEDRLPNIRPAAYRVLAAHGWPGNEAELRTFAEELARESAKGVYEAHDIRLLLKGGSAADGRVTEEGAKRQQLLRVLARNGYRRGATAQALNISRKTLYNRMKRFGLT